MSYTIPLEVVLKNLTKIGPMNYQGYGFKKPQPASELGAIVKDQNGYEPLCLGQ